LRRALALAHEIGEPREQWLNHAAMGRFLAARGDDAGTRQAYRAAQDIVDRVRTSLRHPELRAGRATTAFLSDYPPLSRAPRVSGPWAGSWGRQRGSRPPLTVETTARATEAAGAEQSVVKAPMPGVVVRVLATEGDRVEPRQPLVLLEAMKMETPLVSPYAAVVRRVLVSEGDRVAGGAVLVELEE